MRTLHFRQIITLIMTLLLISTSSIVYAQESEPSDSTIANKSLFVKKIYNKYISLHNAQKHNPLYLKNEANFLKIRIINTGQAPFFDLMPISDKNKKIRFDSDPFVYIGADIGWNIFAAGYSVGVNKTRNSANKRFSFGTYARFFAINAEVYWLHSLNISNIEDFVNNESIEIPEKIQIDNTFFRSRSVQLSIFTNGNKAAFGNTINPVYRQIKSAGTLTFALGYSDYYFDTNLEQLQQLYPDTLMMDWIDEIGIKNLRMYKYELAGGYSYNFVTGRHWVLSLSDMVGLSAKHYYYNMILGDSPTKKTTIGICNYFRTGACYYNKSYFGGIHVLYEIDNLQTDKFLFNKNTITASAYIGYKFRVDGFNRFVSNLLHARIK